MTQLSEDGERLANRGARPPRRGFDVFLSYNSRDRAQVQRLARHLARAGLDPWFDRWSMTPGASWQEEIVAGLQASSTCAVFIGPHDVGGWEREEMSVALIRAVQDRTFRLIPVLLPGLESFEPTTLPPLLASRTWVDLRPGVDSKQGLQDFRNAVLGLPFGPDVHPEPQEGPCPYRGLAVFDEEHAPFYFGRDAQVQRLLEQLRRGRFIAVIGPSGSGKSSLVRAGLIPRIRAGAVPHSQEWDVHVLRPGAHPLAALAAQVLALQPTPGMQTTVDRLAADERTLHLATAAVLADAAPEARVLFVVDQCEEVFTLCRDDDERRAFLANVHYATAVPGGRAAVVLTLRADFYARLARYPALAQFVQSRQMLIGELAEDELRQAIEEPARVVGLDVAPELVDTILADVLREPGILPLLQHALLETWRRRRGGALTLAGYRESGGVQRGLAERAETLFGELTPECQVVAHDVVLRLIQPGDGTEDTRRQISMRELSTVAAAELVEDVVRRMVDERLLTTSVDTARGEDERRVEISHEALIRGWPRLQDWIQTDRAGLRIHRQLTVAAEEWHRLGDDEGVLYRGGKLAEANEWADRADRRLNALERDFLAASRSAELAARSARRRRRRRGLSALVAGLVALSVLVQVAVYYAQQARLQRDYALSQRLAASAASVVDVDPSLSLALAMRAYSTAPTAAAEQILRQAMSESRQTAALRDGDGPVYGAQLFAGGRSMISGGADGTVRIWDAPGRHVTDRIAGHAGKVTGVAATADGRYLASTGADGSVALLTGPSHERSVVVAPTPGVYGTSVAFSTDGRLLATSLSDGTVRVVDVATGHEVRNLRISTEPVFHVAFAPAGASGPNLVITAVGDGTAQVWDAGTGRQVSVLRGHAGWVLGAAFQPDGRSVVTGGVDGTVRVWDVVTGAERKAMQVDTQAVIAVDVSPDGRRLVTGGEDGLVRVWGIDGVELARLPGHFGAVIGVGFDATGDQVVTAGTDGSVRFWDPGTDDAAALTSAQAAFSPDGRRVVVGGTDGHVRVLATDGLVQQLDLDGAQGRCFPRFSPDGSRIVSAAEDGSVRVWDANSGADIAVLHPHRAVAWAAQLDPRDERVISGAQDGTVVLSNLVDHSEVRLPVQRGAVNVAAFSPDGSTIVTAGDDGIVRLWGSSAKPRLLMGHDGAVRGVAFSPDGSLLASAGVDGTVRVWQTAGGTAAAVLRGHQGSVNAVHFAPDGRLTSVGDDGTVRVWDSATSRLLVTLRVHTGPARSVDISPDGRLTLTASQEDRLVKVTACLVCGSIDSVLDLARSRGVRALTLDEEQRYGQ